MSTTSYLEIKSYYEKNNQVQKYIFLVIIFLIIIFSLIKTNSYKSFKLIKNDERNYILCEEKCNLLFKRNKVNIGKESAKYSISNCANGLCELSFDESLKFKDTISVGIYEKKESVIKKVLDIFKEKGVI